jgi:hypothetical protein
MAQFDFTTADGPIVGTKSFPNTRADINSALLALVSNSSGDAEPTGTQANQFWYETDTNTLKIRNEANDGWINVLTLDESMTASASELNLLDDLTRGSILYGDASGETARLAKGAANTVLTSDGTDISWAAAAGGGGSMEFIASSGAISNAADVQFRAQDGHFDSTKYDHYEFWFQHVIPELDAKTLKAQTSTNDGGAYASTDGDYHSNSTTDRDSLPVTHADVGSDTNEFGVSGKFYLFSPHTTSAYTYSKTTTVFMGAASGAIQGGETNSPHQGVGVRLAAEDVDAIKFSFSSGNIESGEIVMYGIKKS